MFFKCSSKQMSFITNVFTTKGLYNKIEAQYTKAEVIFYLTMLWTKWLKIKRHLRTDVTSPFK